MKDVTLKLDHLKKLDYPHTLPPDTAEFVKVSPETLLLSIAISQKRIADALEDGLTSLMADGTVKGVADLLQSTPAGLQTPECLPQSLHNDIIHLAWEAGRSFQSGMKTDR